MVLGWPKMSIWTFPLFWNKHKRVFLANPIFHWAILGVNWSYMSDFRGQLNKPSVFLKTSLSQNNSEDIYTKKGSWNHFLSAGPLAPISS